MKTKEELNAKHAELSGEELAQVTGGNEKNNVLHIHVGADSNQADPIISDSTDDKNRYKYLRIQKTDTDGVF